MGKLKWLITDLVILHGDRNTGVDPFLTVRGIEELLSVTPLVKEFSANSVCLGVATRFEQMLTVLTSSECLNQSYEKYCCEFCGPVSSSITYPRTHSGKKTKFVALYGVDGPKFVQLSHYIGIGNTDEESFKPWILINKSVPTGTIFLCNSPFLCCLVRQSKTKNVKTYSAGVFGLNRNLYKVKFLIRGTSTPDRKFATELQEAIEIVRASRNV